MKKVLCVNPPIYDFTAYDFWLRPYGVLTVGGYLQACCEVSFFDFMDGLSRQDDFGKGRFDGVKVDVPDVLADIPRYYRRFGKSKGEFLNFLHQFGPFDYVLVGTVMTYWYIGYEEVIETVKEVQPEAKIVLGGVYATLCREHSFSLGADFVLSGVDLRPLWDYMEVEANVEGLPFWQGYSSSGNGVIKLSDGCPFNCTYCSVPKVYKGFASRDKERVKKELRYLIERGVENVAFYDDALLGKFDEVLKPFLEYVISIDAGVNFHTPNALNARYIDDEVADLMVEGGVKTFFVGYESSNPSWQGNTGGKVYHSEFERAVESLVSAGAERKNITAYIILGHPQGDMQEVEKSLLAVNAMGVRSMLADFSPIPGTKDGEFCSRWVDMNEPLCHNKSAFGVWVYGFEEINRFKDLCRKLNRAI